MQEPLTGLLGVGHREDAASIRPLAPRACMMACVPVPLSECSPPDLEIVSAAADSPVDKRIAEVAEEGAGEGTPEQQQTSEEETVPGIVSSAYEQHAITALLGLHTAWPTSSPDDDSRDDDSFATGRSGRWERAAERWPMLSSGGYGSPGDSSPKVFRSIDYGTPGPPSPKRSRAPKDGPPPSLLPHALLCQT